MKGRRRLVLATRGSALARWQAEFVRRGLLAAWPELEVEVHVVRTRGDENSDRPLPEIGERGLFTSALEQALLSGQADLAVHSLKDLPTRDTPGLVLGAVPVRADPRDVLVSRDGRDLAGLPPGAAVGTSSPRRRAFLLAARPDLEVQPLRGNVETRLRKVEEGQVEAAVLAAAGLTRLGLARRIAAFLPPERFPPAPGQGALAVQCRAEDEEVLRLLRHLEDEPTRSAVQAERTFLAALGGGCALPVGALGRWRQGSLHLLAAVASPDGSQVLRLEAEGRDPVGLGRRVAEQALEQGAEGLLDAD